MGITSSQLPKDILDKLQTEEDLLDVLENIEENRPIEENENTEQNGQMEEVQNENIEQNGPLGFETINTKDLDIVVEIVEPANKFEIPTEPSQETDFNNSFEDDNLTLDENVDVPMETIEFILEEEQCETCTVCQKQSQKECKCDKCGKFCHINCSTKNERGQHCLFCSKVLDIQEQRQNSKRKQEK